MPSADQRSIGRSRRRARCSGSNDDHALTRWLLGRHDGRFDVDREVAEAGGRGTWERADGRSNGLSGSIGSQRAVSQHSAREIGPDREIVTERSDPGLRRGTTVQQAGEHTGQFGTSGNDRSDKSEGIRSDRAARARVCEGRPGSLRRPCTVSAIPEIEARTAARIMAGECWRRLSGACRRPRRGRHRLAGR